MSIVFHCPDCGALIAFSDQHAGKRAHCVKCQQPFVIPDKSHNKAKTVTDSNRSKSIEKPVPGFYKAAFVTSWAVWFHLRSVTGLVFVMALLCLKFFTAHIDYSFTMGGFRCQMPFGLIIRILVWGSLFWYYLEVIHAAAQNDNHLPAVDMDGGFDFLGKTSRSIYAFCLSLLLCMLPAILAIKLTGSEFSLTATLLTNLGLCFLPILLLAVGVNQDMQVLWRIDTMLAPLIKAFFPYLTCALLIILVWHLQMHAHNYGDEALKGTTHSVKCLYLSAQVGIQFMALFAMRALGLFYRHYACYFSW